MTVNVMVNKERFFGLQQFTSDLGELFNLRILKAYLSLLERSVTTPTHVKVIIFFQDVASDRSSHVLLTVKMQPPIHGLGRCLFASMDAIYAAGLC